MLADEAIALDGADRNAADQRLKAAQEALEDARSDSDRDAASAEMAIAEALLAAIDSSSRN